MDYEQFRARYGAALDRYDAEVKSKLHQQNYQFYLKNQWSLRFMCHLDVMPKLPHQKSELFDTELFYALSMNILQERRTQAEGPVYFVADESLERAVEHFQTRRTPLKFKESIKPFLLSIGWNNHRFGPFNGLAIPRPEFHRWVEKYGEFVKADDEAKFN